MNRNIILSASLLLSLAMQAQEQRASSSIYLQALKKADVNIPFYASAEGKRFEPTWGVDLAWISEQNIMKGVNHMGKENVGIGRIAFRFTDPLVNDSALSSSVISVLRQRCNLFNKIDRQLPLTLTADQEAGTNEYYVVNKAAKNAQWAAMINSHVHWIQQNSRRTIRVARTLQWWVVTR